MAAALADVELQEYTPVEPASPTLDSIAEGIKLDAVTAAALWNHLGLLPSDEPDMVEVAASIPASVLDSSIAEFCAQNQFKAAVSGKISMVFKRIFSIMAPPPSPAALARPTAAAKDEPLVIRHSFSKVLDQGDSNLFEALDRDTRMTMVKRHIKVTGDKPPSCREPSSDQLAALHSRLRREEAPHADFVVFTPSRSSPRSFSQV